MNVNRYEEKYNITDGFETQVLGEEEPQIIIAHLEIIQHLAELGRKGADGDLVDTYDFSNMKMWSYCCIEYEEWATYSLREGNYCLHATRTFPNNDSEGSFKEIIIFPEDSPEYKYFQMFQQAQVHRSELMTSQKLQGETLRKQIDDVSDENITKEEKEKVAQGKAAFLASLGLS